MTAKSQSSKNTHFEFYGQVPTEYPPVPRLSGPGTSPGEQESHTLIQGLTRAT